VTARSATAAIIGAGPAGLMAAEVMATEGVAVTVYDQMPTPGRKFLLAGRGGLNLTHSEELPRFLSRYGKAEPQPRHRVVRGAWPTHLHGHERPRVSARDEGVSAAAVLAGALAFAERDVPAALSLVGLGQ
jgi:NADPH-dependent 2,4-dienoyl-CoA reductase/sulfur reductase-like enzyme